MSSSKNPHVISASPDDTPMMSYLLLVGKSVHAPGHLSISSCSEWNTRANALISPQLEREKWQSQAYTVTLSPRYFDVPSHQVNQGTPYRKHVYKDMYS